MDLSISQVRQTPHTLIIMKSDYPWNQIHSCAPNGGEVEGVDPAPVPMPSAQPTSHRAVRVVAGLVAGALFLPLFLELPSLWMAVIMHWVGSPGATESSFFSPTLQRLATGWLGPWGLIGALAGGGLAWNRTRPRPLDADAHDESPRRGQPGTVLLTFGLVFLVLTAGVFPSVMVWMLGLFYLAPVAVLLLILGIARARGRDGSAARRGTGLLFMALGCTALASAALAGSTLSYLMVAPAQYTSTNGNLPGLIIRWILPPPLLMVGLRCWTDWSASRRRAWGAVFFLVPLATLLVHRTLVTVGFLPLSA